MGNESYFEDDAEYNLSNIGEGGANDFREMRRLIKETLKATCTVQEAWGRVPKLVCSHKASLGKC